MNEQSPDNGSRISTDDGTETSDLIGAKITVAVIGWILATLLCFLFIGSLIGIIVGFVGLLALLAWGASAIKRADVSD